MHGRVGSMTTSIDPRLHYRTVLTWVRTLADGVPADRLTDPTPCAEWDVRGMLGHLVATVDRVRVIGEGGDPQTTPRVVEGIADDGWTDALAAAEDKMAGVWADDAVLDELVTVPWVVFPAGLRCGGTSAKRSSTAGTSPSPPGSPRKPIRSPPRRHWRRRSG